MSDDLWGEEPFNDMPDETQLDDYGNLKQAPPAILAPQPRPQRAQRPQTPQGPVAPEPEEFEVEELIEELEEDLSSVFDDANLRLEQGSLWKLIMKHELFDGVDADAKAIQNVQKAIRKFAKEQMEIMLGMRKETATVETLNIDFPFNQVEVEVLKMLAEKASGGKTKNSDNFVPTVTKTTQEVPTVKKQTLNTISSTKKTQPKSQPLQAQPKKPVQRAAPPRRSKLDAIIDQVAMEEGIPRELLEEGQLLDKPVHLLSEQEILDRNDVVSKRRQKQAKATNAIPMPTYEQQEMLASRLATNASSSHLKGLIDAAKSMPPTKIK